MTSNWKEYKIADLGEIKTGKTPKTSIQENYGGNIPFLTPSDDMSVKYVKETVKKITESGLKEVKSCLLPAGSICVSCIGSDLGKVVITTKPTVTNQQINSIIVDTEQFDTDFCYYLMVQLGKLLNYHSKTSTAVPIINKTNFSSYGVHIPDLETQQKIAKVLSAIDDKIELNNSINNNLEQQAQAIFKSWFVDFEPFGGTMPKEWTKRTLDEFCSIFTGRKNANQFEENGENKFFTCGPNPLKINSYIYDGPAIIISGNGAYTGRTRFYNGKFDLYQRTYACTMLENIDSDYIYLIYVIIKNVLQDKIMGGTHGSAIPYIVMNDIAKFELFYNNEIFKDLSQIMKSIVNEIMHNELENEQLAQLRDTLLPKLMSGEIDVSRVEIDDILENQSADKLLFSEDK